MPYKNARTLKITFEEIGEPDFWVEIRDPAWLTAAEVQDDGGTQVGAEELVRRLILTWNLEHPTTGEVLPIPSVDESGANHIPGEMVRYLSRRLQELTSRPLSPNGSPTSSLPGQTEPAAAGQPG